MCVLSERLLVDSELGRDDRETVGRDGHGGLMGERGCL